MLMPNRVVKLIRGNEKLKDIKILAFSGYPEKNRKLLKLGANHAITKASKEAEPEAFKKMVCNLLRVSLPRNVAIRGG